MATNHEKCRGSCFVTHLMGLPFPVSPFCFPLSNPPRRNQNKPGSIPSERGGGGCGCVLASEVAAVSIVEPTSLSGGEGLIAGQLGVVVGGLWWGGRRWWLEIERGRANTNHDAVDVRLNLRSPSMITFDMNAYKSDNKIKFVSFKTQDVFKIC